MKVLILLLFSVVMMSCKPGTGGNEPQSCKEVCSSQNNISYSVTIPGGIRCLNMRMAARREAKKKGYCYAGPHLIDGIKQDTTDPDPVLCKALVAAAQKKCDQLPPDPSQMNQQVSGTSLYKDGKLFMQNGELVDKCDCTKEGSGKESKALPGKNP